MGSFGDKEMTKFSDGLICTMITMDKDHSFDGQLTAMKYDIYKIDYRQ